MAVLMGWANAVSSRAQYLIKPVLSGAVIGALLLSLGAVAQTVPVAEESHGKAVAWKADTRKDVIEPQGKVVGADQGWGLDWARLEVPLPGTVALFSLGLLCLVVGGRRRGS